MKVFVWLHIHYIGTIKSLTNTFGIKTALIGSLDYTPTPSLRMCQVLLCSLDKSYLDGKHMLTPNQNWTRLNPGKVLLCSPCLVSLNALACNPSLIDRRQREKKTSGRNPNGNDKLVTVTHYSPLQLCSRPIYIVIYDSTLSTPLFDCQNNILTGF